MFPEFCTTFHNIHWWIYSSKVFQYPILTVMVSEGLMLEHAVSLSKHCDSENELSYWFRRTVSYIFIYLSFFLLVKVGLLLSEVLFYNSINYAQLLIRLQVLQNYIIACTFTMVKTNSTSSNNIMTRYLSIINNSILLLYSNCCQYNLARNNLLLLNCCCKHPESSLSARSIACNELISHLIDCC